MHKSYKFYVLFVVLFLFRFSTLEAACPNVTANFSITQSHSCGIPRGVSLSNISTGVDSAISKYYWYINGVLTDSSIGLVTKSRFFNIPGTYFISLVAKSPNDTTCRDSTTQSVLVTTNKPRIFDGNFTLTYSPQWFNCITQLGSNLVYLLQLSVEDTLYGYRIIWGDGTPDSTGTVFSPNIFFNHSYSTLGSYNIKIISTSGGCTDTINGIVNNERIPSAGIIGPPVGTNSGCLPFAVRFVNNSYNTSGSTRFIWDWGDGTADTLGASTFNDTIYHIYKSATFQGTCVKTVTLTSKNNCGNSIASWSSVFLYDKDLAQIGVADTVTCLPKVGNAFVFQNNSNLNCVPGTRLYYWDFGDGTNTGWILQKTNQTHTYSQPGKYRVFLIDSNPCKADTFFLNVYAVTNPTAGITFSSKLGCKPLTVTFTDTVTTNLLLRRRQWDLADTSNGQSRYDTARTVTHTFYRAGIYVVRCVVTNPCDTVSAWVIIEVYETPEAKIMPLGNGCEPFTITAFNQSTKVSPYAHYLWDFGDGTSSILANPAAKTYNTGSYTVKLKITDTCGTDSDQAVIIVHSVGLADYRTDTVCFGDSTHFNADSTKFIGAIINDAFVSFSYKDSITNIVLGSSSTRYFSYRFTTSGWKKITLTAFTQGGCSYNVTKNVFVKERPSVSYSYTPFPNNCNGRSISFFGNSVVSLSIITGYLWDFGDGSFSNSKDTIHTFASPGTYAVKLTAFNNFGCPTTYIDSVRVRYNPKAKIKVSANCFGQITSLIDSSYVLGGDLVTQWAWDYTGNGSFDVFTKNTTYSYGAAGSYTVILRATTNRGCLAYDTAHIIIDTLPNPSFTIDTNSKCMFQPFVFTNTSTRATSFIWKWGDGTANTTVIGNATQQHSYLTFGTFTVKLLAYTIHGCMDSTSLTVLVKPKPKALFAVNDTAVCAPYSFHFINQSTNSNTYQWYVNGILMSTNSVLPDTLVKMDNKLLQIRLIAANTNLCLQDTYNLSVRTFIDPIANFSAFSLDSCNPFTVHFVNTSSGSVTYKWYFNDTSSIDTNRNPTHTFFNNSTKDSVYNVRLISYNIKGCDDTLIMPVHVRPKPLANFSLSRTDSCGPFRVRFTNLSSPGDTESIYTMHFQWNFGNGIVSNARDTTVQFLASLTKDTTYRVKLYAYTKHNCVDTISKTLVVHPNCKANFSMSLADSCGPLRVQFTNSSTPGNSLGISVMTFRWNFGNGITATAKDTAVVFNASPLRDTVYNIRLISFSNYGCPDTMFKQVTVYAMPKAQFTKPDTARCGPATVAFTNTSFPRDTGSINGMTFFWNFGNGLTSTLRHPTTTYTAAKRNDTVYTIMLIAYSSHGCPDTIRSRYRVYPNPIDSFSSTTSGCSPFQVTFNNLTYNGSKYYWFFGDGATDTVISPVHIFTGRYLLDTTYTVKMVSRSIYGCYGDTTIKQITVRARPIADFTANNLTGCTPASIQLLNNTQGAVSSAWSFGDGATSTAINPIHSFVNNTLNDTIFNVRLIVTSALSCKDTIIKPITIYPKPVANFSLSRLDSCGPFTVSFTNTSINGNGLPLSAMTFKWDFGNGIVSTLTNNVVTFIAGNTNDTFYNVKLIVYSNHNCTDTIIKTVTVHPKAKANFTVSRADSCGPFKVFFTNTSINGNGQPISVMSFKWNFGNGVTSFNKDTAVVFAASITKDTTYQVRLIATTNYGCADTITKQIRVYPKPKSRFIMSDTTTCSSAVITFTNTSYPNDTGSINNMTFYWDFGNGRTSLNRNETIAFVSSRLQDTSYRIKLVATSEHGCIDTSIQQLLVHPKPIDSFSVIPSNGCYNFPVQFVNNSINGKKYYWDFGDGTTDTTKNATHYYLNTTYAPVYYYPKMVSISANGCVGDTVTKIIEVKPKPLADFAMAPDSGCSPLRVQLLNMSIAATSFLWNFGDGTFSTQINPVHYFFTDTTYTITLVSTSQWGCTDTMRRTIRVKSYPNGIVNVSNASGCTPLNVQFSNMTTGAVRYEWYFGDGYTDTTKSVTHTYTNNLNVTVVYSMMMLAYNAFGCADTTRYPITVYAKPKANFNFSQPVLCGNSRFKFTDFSINGFTYLWKFSDGTTDTARNPIHDFVPARFTDSIYTATLIVTSFYGCKDTISKVVIVPVLVHAKLKAAPLSGCVPLTVNFTDSSENASSLIWYFGDGFASSIKNPTHTYTAAGKFTVMLVAIGFNGCIDTIKKVNLINAIEVPQASFTASPIQQALPASKVNFTNTSTFTVAVTYLWNFGDGATSTNKDDSHSYLDTGTYKVLLIVTNGFCSDSAFQWVRITPYLPVSKFTVDVNSGCVPLVVTFTNTSTNALSYFWEFGDGNSSLQTNPIHAYQNAGRYTVRLKAYGISGIDDTVMTDFIEVYENPIASFAGGPLVSYLPKGDVAFKNYSIHAVTYRWIITNKLAGITITDTAKNPIINFTRAGLYTVKLIAFTDKGCSDSAQYIDYINVIAGGQLHVPNAFTPDNNKVNDVFKPEGYGITAKGYKFSIYDRWGELVFLTTDPEVGWDGTYNAKACQMDTYVWVLEGKFASEQSFHAKGTVMLLR